MKKEYEAMLLVYKLKLNGVLMDNEQLEIIYLPYQNKVVILSADLPYEPEEISEKHELVSKEKLCHRQYRHWEQILQLIRFL